MAGGDKFWGLFIECLGLSTLCHFKELENLTGKPVDLMTSQVRSESL
jgi:hypothetical protein